MSLDLLEPPTISVSTRYHEYDRIPDDSGAPAVARSCADYRCSHNWSWPGTRCLLLVSYHILLVVAKSNAPPLIKSVFPFIGTALFFARNPESFLRSCQLRFGDIFTLYMTGKRMHIFCDQICGIPTVFRSLKIFNR